MMKTTQIDQEKLQELKNILSRFQIAKNLRQPWESLWDECYDYALPLRAQSMGMAAGIRQMKNLYDSTAIDAVDQLAASLLGHLTPPWTQWFGFKAGPDITEEQAQKLVPLLEKIACKIQTHFDRSNFSMEMHQCFLDLVVGGTSTLYFEEAAIGEYSAFKFTAVPLYEIAYEEGDNGRLDGSYRALSLTLAQMKIRYGEDSLPAYVVKEGSREEDKKYTVIEAITTDDKGRYHYYAILEAQGFPVLLKEGVFASSPAISFRWMKSPGEIYGRSPVMKTLPDIKTANKVVELILKNASIAVTGIWQADDDGVLNPANIELVPGAIIPKAIGSQGLKALEMPGRFDVSELVLNDLRSRIRHALLIDRLGPVVDKKMSATEVLERSSEMALLMGATYGRLQSELLTPLIMRAFYILKRRGEIPDISLDGRTLMIEYRSPLVRMQGQGHVQNVMTWLNAVNGMGVQAGLSVDIGKAVKYLGEVLGVPSDMMTAPLSLSQDQ